MSVHSYGTSGQEIYNMQFGYNPSEKQTYVSIEIKFSLIGRGFICLVPQNFMKSWAIEIGIESIKLLHKKDKLFLENFNQICNSSGQEKVGEKANFCPICGNRLSIRCRFCSECGIEIKVI